MVGISIATVANVKAAYAARHGIAPAFMAGFRGGADDGPWPSWPPRSWARRFCLPAHPAARKPCGLQLRRKLSRHCSPRRARHLHKTADIAAETWRARWSMGIPEDDPRNPAVNADNVGDNVGDVAGMGADLFDSIIASIAAAIVIAIPLGLAELIFCLARLACWPPTAA